MDATIPAPKNPAATPPHRLRKILLAGLGGGVALLTLGALWLFRHPTPTKNQSDVASKPQVPVVTTTVQKGDIGETLQALGTVTPVSTVSVIPRVQGQVMSVNYREGQLIKKGDSLVEIDSRPYDAAVLEAEGTLIHDQGLLKEAEIDLVRYRKAYAKNAIPKQQLDDQEQVVLQDQGTVKADQGALETAKLNVLYCHIASPIDGRVGLRLVDPGNMVQAGSTTALAVITQLQPITVIFNVAEDDIAQIQAQVRKGENMRVDAYDRSQQKKIATGSFLTLDNQVDTTTGTVRVRAVFPNDDDALFPNQFVNAQLLVSTEKNVTLVSSSAIQRGTQGAYVYVVKPDRTVERRTIKPGTTDGDRTAVEGIEPNETVVENGFDKLKNGTKIKVKNDNSTQMAGQVPRS
jgi:multidrug efflux system membrane fusion protein